MKFNIEHNKLLEALAQVKIGAPTSNIPILNNVLIQTEGDGVIFRTSDLDASVDKKVSAKISQAGATTVPVNIFHKIVQKMPRGGLIDVEYDKLLKKLNVSSGTLQYSFETMDSNDFPTCVLEKTTSKFIIKNNIVQKLFKKARYAFTNQETRYYLQGIFMTAIKDRLICVCTDGHRLAKIETKLPKNTNKFPAIIIPIECVDKVLSLLAKNDADVDISISNSRVKFEFGGCTVYSKVVDGTFPDYERIFPKDNDLVMMVDKKVLKTAVEQVTAAASRTSPIKLSLGNNVMTLSIKISGVAEVKKEIEVEHSGDVFEIGFNAAYVSTLMKFIDGDVVEFSFKDNIGPALIRDFASKEKNTISHFIGSSRLENLDTADIWSAYVLMPMRA